MDAPVSISHVVENLNRGGLERVVIDLALTQQAAGHDCQIVCLFERGLLADEAESSGVRVVVCDKGSAGTLAAMRRLRRAVKAHRTEALHTHNATAHYHAVAATLGLPFASVVSTRHGLGDADSRSRRERLYRLALPRTDAIVAVSASLRDSYIDRWTLPPDRVHAIPNGIDVDRFTTTTADARAALRVMIGAPATAPVIGTVGRLNWTKDQATLLQAFARARATHPDARLVLIGGGELRGTLEGLAADLAIENAVHFLGDRSDVPTLLPGFDVFALSSRTEGYSIALLEACAAARPIVATDVGGNREIVRDGSNGRIVPAADPERLGDALSHLLARDDLDSMGAAGRAWVVANGSLRVMADRYLSLYASARSGSAGLHAFGRRAGADSASRIADQSRRPDR